MNLSRCDKGHFYDKEKYATCPHCAGGAADESLTTVFTQEANQDAAGAMPTMPNTMPVVPNAAGGVNAFPGAEVDAFQGAGMPNVPNANAVTAPLHDPSVDLPEASIPADQPTVAMDSSRDTPTMPLQNNPFSLDSMPVTEGTDYDSDHTIGIFDDVFGSVVPHAPAAGTAQANGGVVNKVSTPCVGWLIAIGGGHIGTDFRLKVGKNFIGRNQDMDIALTEDKSVSRERHAIVVYEPKQHLYLVQPGEASSLVYRNNEVVLSPVALEAYDMITVGDVNLLFMPLCGKRFNWSDLFEEMSQRG